MTILSKAQAEAVYRAMCELNNIGGKLTTEMQPSKDQVGLIEVRENTVGEILVLGDKCEIHADQAAFATSYGLGA